MPVSSERRAIFTIKRDELELFLTKYPNTPLSTVAKQVFLDFIRNKDSTMSSQQTKKSDNDEKKEHTKLRNVDLKLKIWDRLKSGGYTLDQLKQILNDGDIPLPENKTLYPVEETTSQPKSTPKFGITVTHTNNKIKQDDGTLRCKRCNKKIDMRAYDFEQLDDYRKHVENTHGKLTDDEREELIQLFPNL